MILEVIGNGEGVRLLPGTNAALLARLPDRIELVRNAEGAFEWTAPKPEPKINKESKADVGQEGVEPPAGVKPGRS
jgi:hypothetical protein